MEEEEEEEEDKEKGDVEGKKLKRTVIVNYGLGFLFCIYLWRLRNNFELLWIHTICRSTYNVVIWHVLTSFDKFQFLTNSSLAPLSLSFSTYLNLTSHWSTYTEVNDYPTNIQFRSATYEYNISILFEVLSWAHSANLEFVLQQIIKPVTFLQYSRSFKKGKERERERERESAQVGVQLSKIY